jgi:hypothetical protein
MPIELLTGQPGNGKTALMMERLHEEAKKAERPIWAIGIDGLAPGLASTLKDAKDWNAVDPDAQGTCDCSASPLPHAHVIPDGSLIFVDEAWKWFGHLHDASRQKTPDHVLQLAEHRHRGIDFVWTTQQPNQLYPFVRGLIARHSHVLRRYGTHFLDVYSWEELNEDVKSTTKRENGIRQTRRLPEQVFGSYQSATQHTIKRRLPLKLFVLPLAIAAAIGAGSYAFAYFKPDAITARLAEEAGTDSGSPEPAPATTSSRADRAGTGTPEEYVLAQMPRVPEAPWSAPIYDDREVTVNPQVVCSIAQAGEMADGSRRAEECMCLTEQGTPYIMPDDDIRSGDARCRHVARWGQPYNPFKPENERRERESKDSPRDAGSPQVAERASAFGVGDPNNLQQAYGGFRSP